jgi:hypothetical protein
MSIRKVSFEYVSAISHPEYYRGDNPCVRPEEVPDNHWTKVERERSAEGATEQYNGLLELIGSGELIRNAELYEAETPAEPQWSKVAPG